MGEEVQTAGNPGSINAFARRVGYEEGNSQILASYNKELFEWRKQVIARALEEAGSETASAVEDVSVNV